MILARTLHGSRMFGLDNPSSDIDYKAIHLPSVGECLLLRARHNAHTKDETGTVKVEAESFALQDFLALAARGEDLAITMLHADNRFVESTSPVFQLLRGERERFYTRGMSGSLGFAKGQAAKYSLRADRMETVEKVIGVLEAMIAKGVAKLGQEWDMLPDLPHTTKGENPLDRNADKRVYEVVGKGLTAPTAPRYALDILIKVRDSYGERVRNARSMGGKDLKAVSHSFRVGYQLKHLYQDGDFYFPLPESDFIRAVKEGKLNYVDDHIDDRLNELIAEVELLASQSFYPESVDQAWLDQVVLDAYGYPFS